MLDRGEVCTASYIKKEARKKDSLNSQRYGRGARRKMMRATRETLGLAKRRSSAARECHGVDYGLENASRRCRVFSFRVSFVKTTGVKCQQLSSSRPTRDRKEGKGCRSSNERA